jgi:hypothetical protein
MINNNVDTREKYKALPSLLVTRSEIQAKLASTNSILSSYAICLVEL